MKHLAPWIAALALAGCASSATTRFHSLLPAPVAGTAAAVASAPPRWDLSVQVPAQVDRPQWVLRGRDEALLVLEYERWIAPLADEIQAAVAERLKSAPGGPGRIALDVQRLDAAPGRFSRIEADWTLRLADGSTRRCRAVVVEPAGESVAALAAAHRAAFARLGDSIAASLSGC